ncbi:MAG: lipoprotein N-acyltransferase Lnb domain-containing protein [Planctomycetota bacterium]|jgi:hypothetical protein
MTPPFAASLARCARILAAALVLAMPGCSTLDLTPRADSPPRQATRRPAGWADDVASDRKTSEESISLPEKAASLLLRLPEGLSKMIEPSNDRHWAPYQAVLPYAEFDGDKITVHNIRNCRYRTADDYTVDHYDKTFDLEELESVDFIVVPFPGIPSLAHVMMSFGFEGDDYLCVSVEIRREEGETYRALYGSLRQFELMYVVGDERDLVKLRTDVHLSGVYVYPALFTPEERRELFVDVMRRVNQLANQPEFYNTFTNNCTTNIVDHLNHLTTRQVSYGHEVLFPGYFDRLLYDLGLIDNGVPFALARQRARVNHLAYLHADSPGFSTEIRR